MHCASIDSIIVDVGLSYAKVSTKPMVAALKKPLQVMKNFNPFNSDFNSCSDIGKLN